VRARLDLSLALAAALGFAARAARAQTPPTVVASAPAGAGQRALSVGFTRAGHLVAATCGRPPCSLAGGVDLGVPPAAEAHRATGSLTVAPIGSGRHAIVVRLPDPARALDWQAVVAAPLGGRAPKVVFSGWTGLAETPDGVRRGKMVMISAPAPDGTRRVAIGEQSEDLELCGRPAILAPEVLDADDLKLHPALVQRLSDAERARAQDVLAQRLADDAPPAAPGLLHAVGASSAVGSPGALTDGNPETTWAENRGGDGRGEFVVMDAPSELPLTGFVVTIRPPHATPEHAVAPEQFWIATDHHLFLVTMPEDAWQHPGARYLVALSHPVRTGCVALVTESAYGKDSAERVTFAELAARTALDARNLPALVAALRRGGAAANAAGAVLGTLGKPACDAIGSAFATLDEDAERIALNAIDGAPCASSVPVYLRALGGPYPALRRHARERIETCGAEGTDAIAAALARAEPRVQPLFASELALVAPARAVGAIAPLLSNADPDLRRQLRVALADAARSPKAVRAVRAVLGETQLGPVAAIDVLRALGPYLPGFEPEAGRALARLAVRGAPFRTRYLLLEPAAALAARDATARAFLARALGSDPDAHVRAQAARVIQGQADAFRAGLLRAVDDSAMRTRQAAIETLGRLRAGFAAPALARRLSADPWPQVRSTAADALARIGPSPALDRALADALADRVASVRERAVHALGARHATRYADRIRASLTDHDEAPAVRAEAARALGTLCDARALSTLTGLARRLANPLATPQAETIGMGALEALGRLHPPDLAQRLAPLLSPRAPPGVRDAARAALAAQPVCRL
jgi:HEAT repeat protein